MNTSQRLAQGRKDSLPGDWYVYRQGVFCHSCRTKEAAIAYARHQIRLWKEAGAPRHPEYAVAYNRTAGTLEALVLTRQGLFHVPPLKTSPRPS